ncbi:hypothetical protein Cob_v000846 [Colletotrichum orbiculare MAFF 240422]|uniref:Uncharacterized protein n=1 Tax=Colletotrichum orbiculare (strain 104-T / ATCC 96160 / CBS 514.97 / LARS 414 / MAFF 240422) TaxID=1213857 RepID=A0A484G9J5_COLOR|nr:hypothetical protein Cob_v000846 [Colletotrichum orbiculare MAFF 240422]
MRYGRSQRRHTQIAEARRNTISRGTVLADAERQSLIDARLDKEVRHLNKEQKTKRSNLSSFLRSVRGHLSWAKPS